MVLAEQEIEMYNVKQDSACYRAYSLNWFKGDVLKDLTNMHLTRVSAEP